MPDQDFNLLSDADKPVYCLNVKDHENCGVQKYILEGEKLGYHERYLTRTRNPWYAIEKRTPAPILFGVFNRGRLKVIRNFTSSINFTCFHSFYPNIFGQQMIDKLFVYLFSDVGQKIIKTNKRSYGDSLDKFEPGDLNESLCPNQMQLGMMSDKDAAEALRLADNDEEAALALSNQLIKKIMNR